MADDYARYLLCSCGSVDQLTHEEGCSFNYNVNTTSEPIMDLFQDPVLYSAMRMQSTPPTTYGPMMNLLMSPICHNAVYTESTPPSTYSVTSSGSGSSIRSDTQPYT